MIRGRGASNPTVVFVADHAQGEDLKTGYSLSGYKEALLVKMCTEAGFDYNTTYRTTLIKDALPELVNFEKGGKGKKKLSDHETARLYLEQVVPNYTSVFINEIKTLKPNLIVPLGELAFQFTTGLEGIRKFRGSILKINPLLGIEKYTKILPAMGPFPYLYQDPKQQFITQIDFNKIPKWWGPEEVPDDTFRIWVARTYESLRNFVERSYEKCLSTPVPEGGYLVFDIETYMNIPTCLSFCFDGVESCCIPLLDLSIPFEQRLLMLDLVAKVLASPIPKVNQNVKFDWKTQERWKFRVNNVVGDTMLASSALYCEFPKNLGFLTSIYTDLPYFKDEGRQYDPSKHKKDQFYLYNAKDSLATHQIYLKQQPEIVEQGVQFVYDKLMLLLPIYRGMEDRGLRVDEQRQSQLLSKYQSLFRRHVMICQRLVNNEAFNPLSSSQAKVVVFEMLGYNPKMRGVNGSTEEEALNMLICYGTPAHCSVGEGKDILREIMWCRKIHKVIEIVDAPIYPDGRFRYEFNLAGAETGRTTGSKTSDYFVMEDTKKPGKIKTINLGHSSQTIGKHGFWIGDTLYGTDIRGMYKPSRGYSLVENDLSGAEARVDRVLSGNFDLTVFDDPGIHKLTGSWVFNCTPAEIKKGTHQYDLAKRTRHAGERNMTHGRLYQMAQDEGIGLSLSLKECKTMLERFHAYAPEIQGVYHRDIAAAIRATHVLIAPNGRRRDFFAINVDHDSINEGISFLPQAIVSDQNKFSFIPTSQEAPWAHFLSESHDSGLAEVPCGREREFCSIYKKNIETPIDFRKGSLKRDYLLTIPCEMSFGEDWENLEDLVL